MDLENYYGRRVLVSRYEVKQSEFKNYQQSELTLVISDAIAAIMSRQNRWVLCHKVSSIVRIALILDDVSTLNKFYHVPEPNQFTVIEPVLTWKGKLSPLQQQASRKNFPGNGCSCSAIIMGSYGCRKD